MRHPYYLRFQHSILFGQRPQHLLSLSRFICTTCIVFFHQTCKFDNWLLVSKVILKDLWTMITIPSNPNSRFQLNMPQKVSGQCTKNFDELREAVKNYLADFSQKSSIYDPLLVSQSLSSRDIAVWGRKNSLFLLPNCLQVSQSCLNFVSKLSQYCLQVISKLSFFF